MATTFIIEKSLTTFPCAKLTEIMQLGISAATPATIGSARAFALPADRETEFLGHLSRYINSLPDADRPKRGDIILPSEEEEYGYGFWTGNRVVLLDRDFEPGYGTVPKEFCAIDEFRNIRHFDGGSKYSFFPIGPGARRRIIFGKVVLQTKDEFVFKLTLDGLRGVGYIATHFLDEEARENLDLTRFRITPAFAEKFVNASYNMSEAEDSIHTQDDELDRAMGEAEMILMYSP